MQDTYIVDRIEDGRWAVLEAPDGHTFPVPRSWLPEAVREGDALRISAEAEPGDGNACVLSIELDAEERQRREEKLTALRERLPRGPSGDLEL